MSAYPSTESEVESFRSRVTGLDFGELAELVKCCCCQDVALPPIHSCVQGHNVCSTCHLVTGRYRLCQDCNKVHPPCMVCNSHIFRNIVMEQILEKCKLRCVYASEGCGFIGNGSEMAAHKQNCDLSTANS